MEAPRRRARAARASAPRAEGSAASRCCGVVARPLQAALAAAASPTPAFRLPWPAGAASERAVSGRGSPPRRRAAAGGPLLSLALCPAPQRRQRQIPGGREDPRLPFLLCCCCFFVVVVAFFKKKKKNPVCLKTKSLSWIFFLIFFFPPCLNICIE